nr:hypothetical protein [Tanacetum cinerariifolium]
MGTVEDKILVPKPPKNCARYFQNSSEPSYASTNVVNAPREPYVIKQDNGSFVNKIIFDLNRAPNLPNKFHCFHCKDVLRYGEACKRCTCEKCRNGLGKGLCYICGHNQNSLNDSPSISETSSQSPPNINHCCYECGDPLDGIFRKRCTCKSCGKDTHIGYNCPSKVSVISNPKPYNNQTIDELPQHCQFFIRHSIMKLKVHSLWTPLLLMLMNLLTFSTHLHNLLCTLVNFAGTMLIMATIVHLHLRLSIRSRVTIKTLVSRKIFKMSHNNILFVMIAGLLMTLTNLNSTLAKIKDQMTSITSLYELACQVAQKKLEEKQIEEERTTKAKYWKLPVCYDDDDDEERFDSLDDNIISGLPLFSAITPDEPVLSTEELGNSLSIGDEHLDTILETESDEFIKSGVETLIPIPSESEGIPEHMCDVPSHDNSPPLDVSKDQFEDFSESDSYELTDELISFISAPEYDCFFFKVEPNSRDFTKDVVENISPTKEPIPGFMKILANGFHYLKSSLSPVFNLGITYPYLID